MNFRILVCGDREWTNYKRIYSELKWIQILSNIECIIEGEARGADKLGRKAAEELNIKVLPFPADWDKYKKAAGPIRNRQMLKEGKPNLVLAFHSNIEKSKGTADMIDIAKKAGITTRLFKR